MWWVILVVGIIAFNLLYKSPTDKYIERQSKTIKQLDRNKEMIDILIKLKVITDEEMHAMRNMAFAEFHFNNVRHRGLIG